MSLTDKQIKALKPETKPRRYFDGQGLYLEVAPNGTKKWRLKYRINGVEKLLALGIYPEVSLLEARDKAREHKKTLKDGTDPAVEKNALWPDHNACSSTLGKNGSRRKSLAGNRTMSWHRVPTEAPCLQVYRKITSRLLGAVRYPWHVQNHN